MDRSNLPVILNFDNAIGDIGPATTIELGDWQERIRFGCSLETLQKLNNLLHEIMPPEYGSVLLGSGDYHHLSWPLIERKKAQGPLQIIVFDNHPDNMRFPLGVHCGSWVRKVALLPYVSHVHVLGISSQDISWRGAFENYLWPLLRGKLTYWCMDVDVRWASLLGLQKSFRCFADPDNLIKTFLNELKLQPTYLSIDKDALSEKVVKTNWDQGRMLEQHLSQVIGALRGYIIGSDITGDVSVWHYSTWWKKTLSGLDGQTEIPEALLQQWQRQQNELNRRLLQEIAAATII